MKSIPLTNLGFVSPISDISSANLGPEVFTTGNNIRAIDDKLVSFNGKSLLYQPTTNFYAGLLDILVLGGNIFNVILGRAICKVYNGTSWYDITPSSLVAAPMTLNQELDWTGTKLGNIPIYNNPNHYPVYWSPQSTSQVLQLLKYDATQTWKDMLWSCASLRSHKNFLFALNMTENGVQYPYSYRWSHPADINGMPPSWNDADLNYIASKEQISGSNGKIIDGASIRDAFCIYSENAITMLDYAGDEFVWRARQLSSSYGAIATNTIATLNNVNYFLTDGDIIANDGNNLQSIFTKRVRRSFASSISNSNYKNSFAIAVPNMSEIWFFIVNEGYTNPSIIYIFNTITGTLVTRDCADITHAAYGPLQGADDSFDGGAAGTMDTWPSSFDDLAYSPFSAQVQGTGASDSAIYTLNVNSGNYDTVLERIGFAPDGLTSATTIVAWYPQFDVTGNISFQAGTQQYIDGPITWKQPIIFNTATDRRIALRTTGKLHCWRFSSIGDTKLKLSGLTIEYVQAGAR